MGRFIHTYLGIILDYIIKEEVAVSMLDYVQEVIDTFLNKEEIKRQVKTPATEHLFEVRNATKLAADKARIFII